MKYTIITTFYNGKNILDSCLYHTISTIKNKSDIEIIVVNDNPQISIENIINKYTSDISIKLINVDKNGGHPKACNIGANAANGDYLIFMDCDIFPTSGWLDEMQKSFTQNNNVGSVSATVVDMSTNRITITGIELHGVDCLKPYREQFVDNLNIDGDRSYTFTPSGCFMLKRETFKNINGFNPLYFNAYGDMDLSGKIFESGYNNYVCTKAIVYHRGNIGGEMRSLSVMDTKALFFKEWGNKEVNNGLKFFAQECKNFSQVTPIEKEYIFINFSNTLYLDDYISTISKELEIKVIDIFNFKNLSDKPVIFDDVLGVELCMQTYPLILFFKRFTYANNNYFWSQNRCNKNDIVCDMNGNFVLAKDLLENNSF